MAKWADYLISEVLYDLNHIILRVKQHTDNGKTIDQGKIIDRDTLTNNLGHGAKYMTLYNDLDKVRIGKNIRYFRAYEHHYVRIDNNKVTSDDLGDLPKIQESVNEEKPPLPQPKPKPTGETKPLSASSSTFFAEPVEETVEPVEETVEPVEETVEPVEETVKQPKKSRNTKHKTPVKKKRTAKKKRAPVKKKRAPVKKKRTAKKKRAPVKKKRTAKKKRAPVKKKRR